VKQHLAICGASATGKTDLALSLAERLGDIELVSVDSMCVYRELDIGTAKPLGPEWEVVPWHLLDLVDPSEEFSVSMFQAAARDALAGIEERDRRAVLVGGTGLYHRAVIDDLEIPARWPDVAAELASEAASPDGVAALYGRLSELDPLAASRIEPNNARRLIRALEVTLGSGRPFSSFGPGLGDYAGSRFVLVGLRLGREETARRLADRLDSQLAAGFVDEVRALSARRPALSKTARQALGYRELLSHVEEGVPLDEARAEALRRMRSFTKRQESWFGRDPRIVWFDADRPDLVEAVVSLLEGRHTRQVTAAPLTSLTVHKLHGAGNDFLVQIDPDDAQPIGAELVRALCHRRTGIGADGLIRALAPRAGGDLRMELRNADGSRAETSGNGLRCLVLAARRAGLVDGTSIKVETDAGLRSVEVGADGEISVEMGSVEVETDDVELAGIGGRARRVDVGNPHLVIVLEKLIDADISLIGPQFDVNVELIAPAPEDGAIDLVVWERGVGETLACGSGSCAAAAVARAFGLCGERVVVNNPGGPLTVELRGDALRPLARLAGPTSYVANITVEVAPA
jgi:tRNA dimethylallyltransferase